MATSGDVMTKCPSCGLTLPLSHLSCQSCTRCKYFFMGVPWAVPAATETRTIRVSGNRFRKLVLTDDDKAKLRQVRMMASEIMLANGLEEYVFRWSESRVKLGECLSYRGYGDGVMVLSMPFALSADLEITRDTCLHEAAHLIVGPARGHDQTWAEKARSLGCRDLSPCSTKVVTAGVVYFTTCSTCGRLYERDRAPRPDARYLCRECPATGPELVWRVAGQ